MLLGLSGRTVEECLLYHLFGSGRTLNNRVMT